MRDTGVCKFCGHSIYRASQGLYPWVHEDGIALCLTATYASPELD